MSFKSEAKRIILQLIGAAIVVAVLILFYWWRLQ